MAVKDRLTPARTSPNAATATSETARPVAIVWGLTRILIGWIFLWAFLDKLFGLGYSTPSARSWLNGGSPTKGFLSHSEGPFAGFYRGIAGAPLADWLFMLALLGLGIALVLGIGMRVAAISGALLYVMMWTVVLPPATNPIVDDHLLGALVVVGLALTFAGDVLGFGRQWRNTPLVKRVPWLG